MNETFTRIPVGKILPSPYQYRKSFEKLEELADSIRTHGVLQPVRVRPNGSPDTFELIFGERRLRAAKLAGLEDIPAIVVELADDKVIEEQLIENLKREDVPPLEEAQGYHNLLHKHGYSMDQLVAKTGRSKAHLYGRIKLLGLAPGARKALSDGRLSAMVAELIARIPNTKLQEQAAKECLGDGKWEAYNRSGVTGEQIESEDDRSREQQPLSYRAAAQLVRRRYQTRLEIARFDPADATLIEKVGACTTCPHRAGNQPALPGLETKADEDYCTNTSCFENKVQAQFERQADAARAKGLKVIDGAAAKKILPYAGDTVASDAPYVDLKQHLPYEIAKPGSNATFGSLLGKKADEIPRVLVQDPNTGAARVLLDKGAAVRALHELGKIDSAKKRLTSSSGSASDAEHRKERAKLKAKRELQVAAFGRFLDQVVAGAAKDPGSKELALWRWIARAIATDVHYEGAELLVSRRGLKNSDEIHDLGDSLKTVGDVRGFVAEVLLASLADRYVDGYAGKEERELLAAAEKVFGADWDKALAAAKDVAKVEAKSDAAKGAKKAKKGGGK